MRSQALGPRVDNLERRVTMLEELPARIDRVESQIVQLRADMRDGFSAVVATLREEIRTTNEQTVATLREEIRATNAQTVERLTEVIEAARRETRVLFEEALGRIALLDEGRRNEGGKSKKK